MIANDTKCVALLKFLHCRWSERGLDNSVSCNTILYREAVVALKLTSTCKLCCCKHGVWKESW